jgi:hypothetical protein
MRRIPFLIGLSLATLSFAHAPEAFAAKATSAQQDELPKIVVTGIAEFDEVFMKAKSIHDSIDAETSTLKSAHTDINTTLGLAADAPLKSALDDLKTKAGGKIKVAMKGTTPRLEPSEAVPENVQKGIDAVNKLIDASEHAVETGEGLVPQAKEVASAAAGFPAKLPTVVKDPKQLLDARKKVTDDVKATVATPDRIDRLVTECKATFDDVKAAIPM